MEDKFINSKINGLKMNFKCDECQHEQLVNIFPYINFSENPEYYALVKDLSIYKVVCEKCRKESLIKFDSLFLDETHKYLLYFLSDKSLHNRFKYQIRYFVETALNKDNKYDLDNEFKTRLVFNHNDLIEKMNIFEIGLNDEAIEIIKAGIYEKNIIDKSIYDFIYFDGLNEANLEFVSFNSKSDSIEPKKCIIDFKFYNKIIDDIQIISNRKRDYFEVIDQNWVKTNFKK